MINKDYLVKQLKSLENRVVADKNWKREQRKLLLSQLRGQTEDIIGLETEKELNIFSHFQMLLKPVVLLLVFVLGSGWLGVVASEQSLPGDLLYPIKITSEKAKVGLTFDKNKKAELHVELAKKRVGEIKELKKKEVEEQKTVQTEVIQETYNKVKEEINEAKNALQELNDESKVNVNADEKKEKTVELVKTVEKVDDGVKNLTKDLSEILEGENKDVLNEEIVGGDKVIMVEETLGNLQELGDNVNIIVKEVVEGSKDDISSDSEASEAVSKILERSASELQEKTDKLIGDGESQEISSGDETLENGGSIELDNVKEEEVLETEEIVEELADANLESGNQEETNVEETTEEAEKTVSGLLDEEALAKIEALISDENMVITLEEGKELADILNQEVINLLNNGEFDKALAHLETSKIIVNKMEVAAKEIVAEDTVEDAEADNVEENHGGLSQEVIVGGETIEEEEVIEGNSSTTEEISVEEDQLSQEIIEEDKLEELIDSSETN